jgi:hypothetical protein
MSYNFNPMTDEELEANNLIEDGEYDFEVVKSTRSTSSKGNPMAALQITIWDKEGKTHTVFDWLVFSQINLCIKKVSHFCSAVGLLEEYKKGEIPEDLERFCGRAIIGQVLGQEIPEEKLQGKPIGSKYPDKNVVVDYVKGSAKPRKVGVDKEPSESKEFDDDIPF